MVEVASRIYVPTDAIRGRMVLKTVVTIVGISLLVSGCEALSEGKPQRTLAVKQHSEEFALAANKYAVENYYSAGSENERKAIRNNVITARMYAIDVQYTEFETTLLLDSQRAGLVGDITNIGLSTAATLVTQNATKTILSALAAGVTGVHNSYAERILLAKAPELLQSQMRASRDRMASVIFTRMTTLDTTKYTLGMGFSDVEAYYRAGTISSAIVKLAETVAKAGETAKLTKEVKAEEPNASEKRTIEKIEKKRKVAVN